MENMFEDLEKKISGFWVMKKPVLKKNYYKILDIKKDDYSEEEFITNISWLEAIYFCNILSKKQGLEPTYRILKGKEKKDISKSIDSLPKEEWDKIIKNFEEFKSEILSGGSIRSENFSNYICIEIIENNNGYRLANLKILMSIEENLKNFVEYEWLEDRVPFTKKEMPFENASRLIYNKDFPKKLIYNSFGYKNEKLGFRVIRKSKEQ